MIAQAGTGRHLTRTSAFVPTKCRHEFARLAAPEDIFIRECKPSVVICNLFYLSLSICRTGSTRQDRASIHLPLASSLPMCPLPHPLLSKEEYDRLPVAQQTGWVKSTRAELRAKQWSRWTCVPALALGCLGAIFLLIVIVIAAAVGSDGFLPGSLGGCIAAGVLFSVASVAVGVLGCLKARSTRTHGDQLPLYMRAPMATGMDRVNNAVGWQFANQMLTDANRQAVYAGNPY